MYEVRSTTTTITTADVITTIVLALLRSAAHVRGNTSSSI